MDHRASRCPGGEDRCGGYLRVASRGVRAASPVDAEVGDRKIEGAEIIGYDPARRSYVTQYFGSDGPSAYEASLSEEGSLVWRMRSEANRFTGTFSDDGNVIAGHWELRDDSNWQPWMEITLSKQAG